MDYKFGSKNDWRRWTWNRIIERFAIEPRIYPENATVLYLAGEQDWDYEIALSKGFRKENLIAIENKRSIVNKLRSQRKMVIYGDIKDCIYNWPLYKKVDVVIIDLCGGYTTDIEHLLHQFFSTSFSSSVIAINLMRGRDKYFSSFDEVYKNVSVEMFESMMDRKRELNPNPDFYYSTLNIDKKHRAAFAVSMYIRNISRFLCGGCSLNKGYFNYNHSWDYKKIKEQYNLLQDSLYDIANPTFNTYKSTAGNLYFDSCVFRNPIGLVGLLSFEIWLDMINKEKIESSNHRIKNYITAILAVRTKKFNEACRE